VASLMTRLLAQATKQGPVLYTAHGFHFYGGAPIAAWLLYYPAEKLAAKWTDGLIVMNHEDLQNANRLGLRRNQVFLVHGVGVDLGLFDRGRALEPTSYPEFQPPVFICVGEMNRNKNQEFLLRGWLHYSRSHEGSLLLVGDGPNKERLMSLVEKWRITGVHFLGYRDDVPDLLLRSDVVVLTSLREGLPRCLLEGMAARKPIIATDVRGSRDLVSDGVTGLLVKPGDVLALSSAMTRLATDIDLRVAMGRKGFERVREYSLDRTVREMASIYQKYI
jgi:glycosyltransferase involved in cell wall biosynthesis